MPSSGTMVIQSGAYHCLTIGVSLCNLYGILKNVFTDVNLLQPAVPRLCVSLALFSETEKSLELPSSEASNWMFSEEQCSKIHVQNA